MVDLLANVGIGLSVILSVVILSFCIYLFTVKVENPERLSNKKGKVLYYVGGIATTVFTILGTAILSYSIAQVLRGVVT